VVCAQELTHAQSEERGVWKMNCVEKAAVWSFGECERGEFEGVVACVDSDLGH
jgi:hypothetical protein